MGLWNSATNEIGLFLEAGRDNWQALNRVQMFWGISRLIAFILIKDSRVESTIFGLLISMLPEG